MSILGIASGAQNLYGVVASADDGVPRAASFHEAPIDGSSSTGLADALQALMHETGVTHVALSLSVTDAWIARLPGQEHLHRGTERIKAARLFAEREGFSAASNVRVVRAHDGAYHLAVAEADRIDTLARLVHAAGGHLALLDHESYAWASVVPDGIQALVVSAPEDIKLFLFGTTTVEAGRFTVAEYASAGLSDESSQTKIARAIAGAILRASQDGFVDVHRVAVLEDDCALERELANFVAVGVRVEPYVFDDPERTAWARAAGVALRGVSDHGERLYVNFFDSRTRWEETRAKLRSLVSPSDLVVLGVGFAAALAIFGWRVETMHSLERQALSLEARVVAARRDASVIDRELAGLSSARAVVRRVDDARRSGPLVARDLARISRGIGDGLSATTLTTDQAGWTLTGHAREFPQIARLMAAMTAAGFSPSLNGSEQQGERVAYAVTFPRAVAAAPTP